MDLESISCQTVGLATRWTPILPLTGSGLTFYMDQIHDILDHTVIQVARNKTCVFVDVKNEPLLSIARKDLHFADPSTNGRILYLAGIPPSEKCEGHIHA